MAKICGKVQNDRRLTVHEKEDKAEISTESCHQIQTEHLQMKRFAVKYVPRLLTFELKSFKILKIVLLTLIPVVFLVSKQN